ncbi:LysR family transcriptional regulator [Variovorax sp. WS11]|uniref:LysR family transcriptional regulator n=1 Tax=Variovorax sp. WS11 TaxID=1105204 RepID=UPI000D0D1FD5|nr:LysR family transcriptional regulator [Variovorax sp. WS11]NDZ12203.1 LysR family transcriptional regulator [Variovorax sp. WS11]PSL84603.1 LysR family transcriptional regulator [Variovorax sp. WS11]
MDRITASQVFVNVAERGSMTATAEALDMSRAMVTRYLAQMENWAGARLLHRTTRRLSLTAAGEETLGRCRQMLEIAGQMPVAADTPADVPQGLLRLSCAQSLAQDVIAAAVAAYLRQYPRTAIDLSISSRTVNLVEERIDLAIRITNDLDPNLIARPLGHCASVICATPAYLKAHGTPRSPQELALHNCLTYSYFGKSLWQFEHKGSHVAVPVGGNLSANESSVLLTAALEGAGIAMQPEYSTAPWVASGRLVALLPEWRPLAMGVYGVYSSRRQMPAALRAMLDFLAARFADERYWPPAPPMKKR